MDLEKLNSKRILIGLAIVVVAVVLISSLMQKSCRRGYESPAYYKLKGEFSVLKEEARKRAVELELSDLATELKEAELRKEIDELEISKGLILAGSAERNKKIFEQGLELKDLQEQEANMTKAEDKVKNLRVQVSTLQSNFTLAIKDRDKEKKAREKSDAEIVKLEAIIVLRDITIGKLRPALAAERVARLACEGLVKEGEKNSVFNKIGKFVGTGFKWYGYYCAGREFVNAVKK